MGIFITALLGYSVFYLKSIKLRLIYLLQIPISVFIIFKSGALQGYLVTLLGCTVVGAFYLWFKLKSKILFAVFSLVAAASGIVGVLGILQKIPLQNFQSGPNLNYNLAG
jgi:hypothetical protein